MKLKPIVPGCLAIVLSGEETAGTVVKVLELCEEGHVYRSRDDESTHVYNERAWYIDPGFAHPSGLEWTEPERDLMRIDPDADQFEDERERETPIHSPATTTGVI